jgi:hypothetical protein
MKRFLFAVACVISSLSRLSAEEAPALFHGIFTPNQPRMAEVVIMVPPAEIEKYVTKVEQQAKADPKWFTEYVKGSKPSSPLPYHEKLGLTKEEYDAYTQLWSKREFKVVEEIPLTLRQGSDKLWYIFGVESAAVFTSLRFNVTDDTWKSTNGVMARIEDINADATTILGAWKGKEWKFQEESVFSKIKENLAIGETGDGKYNLFVYRAQEITSAGTPTLDKSLVVRIAKVPAVSGKPVKKP